MSKKRILCITQIPYFHMLFLREITIFFKNQSENFRRAKMRINLCYADIELSVLLNFLRKEPFASQNLPIFTCYSYERLGLFPEINQRILEGQKCG